MIESPLTRRPIRARGKSLWARCLRMTGLLGLAKRWVKREGTVVLTFHRVLNDAELECTASLMGMIVRSRTFDGFLAYAADHLEIVNAASDPVWTNNGKLKVAVTFDDGWCDNATEAFPIAKRHKAPVTIFIVARRIGTVLPFWPEQAAAVLSKGQNPESSNRQEEMEKMIEHLKGLPSAERKHLINRITKGDQFFGACGDVDRTMTWEQIEELKAGGVAFGSHTSTHEILTKIPLTQAEEEIGSSRELISQKLGSECETFAYPNGESSAETRRLVAQAGYKRAFINQWPDIWTSKTDPFAIPRVNVCEYHLVDANGDFSPLIFEYAVIWAAARCHLLGKIYGFFGGLKNDRTAFSKANALSAHEKNT